MEIKSFQFSVEQQCFHYERDPENIPKQWQVIACDVPLSLANKFSDGLYQKMRKGFVVKDLPHIKKMWSSFEAKEMPIFLEKMHLISQIQRLCEKQYRKGLQHGFYASVNKELTMQQVNKFRLSGESENYSIVKSPFSGTTERPKERLLAEMQMTDMDQLIELFNQF